MYHHLFQCLKNFLCTRQIPLSKFKERMYSKVDNIRFKQVTITRENTLTPSEYIEPTQYLGKTISFKDEK